MAIHSVATFPRVCTVFHHSTSRRLSGALLGAMVMVSFQGCKRTDVVSSSVLPSPASAVYVEDSVLTSRVRAALILSPVQRSTHINIESHQGVVLLSGTVADKTQMDLAVFVAQTVPGVSQVDSLMLSTGIAPALANRRSYSPNLGEPRGRRLLQSDRSIEPVSLTAPQQDNALGLQPAEATSSRASCPVYLAYAVLGNRSIQDELLTKQ